MMKTAKIKIGICLPSGHVPHECNFHKTKKANKTAFYKFYTMTNDVKIAAFIKSQTTILN